MPGPAYDARHPLAPLPGAPLPAPEWGVTAAPAFGGAVVGSEQDNSVIIEAEPFKRRKDFTG